MARDHARDRALRARGFRARGALAKLNDGGDDGGRGGGGSGSVGGARDTGAIVAMNPSRYIEMETMEAGGDAGAGAGGVTGQQGVTDLRPGRPLCPRARACLACTDARCTAPRCGTCAAMLVLLFAALTIAYWPSYPVYNVCEQAWQWDSFFRHLVYLDGIEGDLMLLLSVYNPNRFALRVRTVTATFSHRNLTVGSFELDGGVQLAAGSVTDVRALLRFTPSATQAMYLLYDYEAGRLSLDLGADFEADVAVGGLPVYSLRSSVPAHALQLNGLADRSICVCKDF
eukprot:g6328.t1